MPSRPIPQCKAPRCGKLAEPGSGYCAACRPAAQAQARAEQSAHDNRRGSAASRGYDYRWSQAIGPFKALFPLSAGYLTCTPYWTPNLAHQFHTLREAAAHAGQFTEFFKCGNQETSQNQPDRSGPIPFASTFNFSGSGLRFLAQFPIYTFHPSPRMAPGEAVDHIKVINGPADPLFYAPWNWQNISHDQHSEKTARFDGGFRGRAPTALHRSHSSSRSHSVP